MNRNRYQRVQIAPRKPIYVYHWDRIAAAFAALSVLLAAGASGLYVWLAPDPEEAPPAQLHSAAQAPPAEPEAASGEASASETGSAQVEPEPEHASTPPHPPAVPTGPRRIATAPSAAAASSPDAGQARPQSVSSAEDQSFALGPEAHAPPTDTPEAESTAVASGSDTPPAEPPKPATARKPAASETQPGSRATPPEPRMTASRNQTDAAEEGPGGDDTAEAPFKLRDIAILDPRVKRFQLAKQVIRKEPQGELGEIAFNASGSAGVFAYSEVLDRRGATLHYVWLHEDESVAGVSVAVRGNRWRSHSSKIINRRMTGDWRVELQDGSGRLLASGEFHVR